MKGQNSHGVAIEKPPISLKRRFRVKLTARDKRIVRDERIDQLQSEGHTLEYIGTVVNLTKGAVSKRLRAYRANQAEIARQEREAI